MGKLYSCDEIAEIAGLKAAGDEFALSTLKGRIFILTPLVLVSKEITNNRRSLNFTYQEAALMHQKLQIILG